jgi:hypothetical protein
MTLVVSASLIFCAVWIYTALEKLGEKWRRRNNDKPLPSDWKNEFKKGGK